MMTSYPVKPTSASVVLLLLAPSLLLFVPAMFSTENSAAAVPASPTSWLKYSNNPVLSPGAPGSFDSKEINTRAIVKSGSKYFLYYDGDGGTGARIGLATSSDGKSFTKHAANPIIPKGSSSSVIKDGAAFKMWYLGESGLHHATSNDGMVWNDYPYNPVLANGSAGEWDAMYWYVNVIKDGNVYKMWYTAGKSTDLRIGYATSPDGILWTKYAANPVLVQEAFWETIQVHSPCVLRVSGVYQMWYSAYNGQFSRICHANSTDGILWLKSPQNPLMPASAPWESPNTLCPVVLYDGRDYRMWYTGADYDWHTQVGFAESTTTGPTAPEPRSPLDNGWTNNSLPVFSWRFGPPGNPNAQSAYQFQLDDSLELSSLLVDTGMVPSSEQSHTLTESLPDGTYFWQVKAWDELGGESAWSGIWTTRIDNVRPAITNFTINEGAAFTSLSTLRLSFNASDPEPGSGLAEMRYTTNSVDWMPWTLFQKTLLIELSAGDREWTVSMEVRDRVNNTSPAANDSILMDTTPPTQTSLRINNGARFANNIAVSLSISANDPAPATGLGEMAFSNDGVGWSVWEPFNSSRAHNLIPGDGQRTVSVKVRDRAGNAGAPVNASIILDTIPPIASILPMALLSEDTNLSVGWMALDALSGIGRFDIEYQENVGAWTPWLNGTNLNQSTFTGKDGSTYSFRARAFDNAGNAGAFPATVSNKIRVNIPQPTVAILEPAVSRTMKGKLLAAGTAGHPKVGKQVTAVEVSLDGGPWTAALGTLSWTYELDTTKLQNGWHNISARAFDGVKYSAVATTDYKVLNKPASTPTTSIPLVFPLVMVIVIIVVVAILLVLRRSQPPARPVNTGKDPPKTPPPY